MKEDLERKQLEGTGSTLKLRSLREEEAIKKPRNVTRPGTTPEVPVK